jgi:CheY-like chemotaxis protein
MPARAVADNHIEVAARLDGDVIRLTVRDNGAGIPDDIKPRIFDPFFTTKPTGVGTGLGLALSHRFVAAMNGTLTVESAVAVGTTFTVTVPRAPAPAPAPAPAKARVLLVDDDVGLRRAISRLLAPHDVTVAESGPAALALLESGAGFDAILCDVDMPGMTGPELVAAVGNGHPALARRVVYMTGNSLLLDGKVPPDAPRLEKPFTRQALAQVMATALAR